MASVYTLRQLLSPAFNVPDLVAMHPAPQYFLPYVILHIRGAIVWILCDCMGCVCVVWFCLLKQYHYVALAVLELSV